ncbi:hypothetical protein OJ996_20530 [Luteolibacter sp. GHJ8]|uniref:Uncharacterized protein n=1 Tax=Luteolibacter rhizosphaerae TaxID=2989719 RepID=A0ABT3G808_9BACT|nr:hypothetical protein [Luteolibacter rhizosphaerae]MCW1915986.1 hypothetical protein [Luteolibacter rhizosphaerae]
MNPRHYFKVGIRDDFALDMVVELRPSAYNGQAPATESERIARDMLVNFMRHEWDWNGEDKEIRPVQVRLEVPKPLNAYHMAHGALWCSRF